MEKQNFNK